MSFCYIVENQCFEIRWPYTGHSKATAMRTIQSIFDFLLIYIGDKISKNGIIVSGFSVKGTISPHNDRNADKGVKVFSYTAYCRSRIKGDMFSLSISINDTSYRRNYFVLPNGIIFVLVSIKLL